MDVLLVEDSHGDARLAQEAFLASETPVRLHIARDGIEAMEFLLHETLPRPDLILLDLNLPKLDGRELLLRIKQDHSLKTIPTVILSTSDAEEDVKYCYRQHANCYIKKPQQWDAFVKVVKFVNDFFLQVIKPQHDPEDPIFQDILADRFYF
jgi:chemotaxis family two-component system response regulator Rcp1